MKMDYLSYVLINKVERIDVREIIIFGTKISKDWVEKDFWRVLPNYYRGLRIGLCGCSVLHIESLFWSFQLLNLWKKI
jgi:hypothetical protein